MSKRVPRSLIIYGLLLELVGPWGSIEPRRRLSDAGVGVLRIGVGSRGSVEPLPRIIGHWHWDHYSVDDGCRGGFSSSPKAVKG